MSNSVVVIGAGIGGLTAAALLAKRGYSVTIYDQAYVPGGCASTFKRHGFTFDVGATQVAGLEKDGIHEQIFTELGMDVPPATPCDPACTVYLPGETTPINIWRDRKQWREERNRQFPGSEPFWRVMETLFTASWRFQARDPVLPPRNLWDLWQLISAVRPDTLITLPFALLTVGDVLRLFRLYDDKRLRTFLDMQLKLYSQVNADETALLYAATALGVSQFPQGLWHLQGSMQVLSTRLVKGLRKHGGKIKLRHSVQRVHCEKGSITGVTIRNDQTGEIWRDQADAVIANVTVQNLLKLLADPDNSFGSADLFLRGYQRRVENLPSANGAFVLYLGVDRRAIPENCPPHLQFLYDYEDVVGEKNSLFVSVSKPGDGRAPEGQATITASSFTDVTQWWTKTPEEYEALKEDYVKTAIQRLSQYFHLTPETIIHQEAATPRTFARFTARESGYVGGLGQRVSTFGPFGFANRTPIENLWLVGDCTHPGEGTAGVSYSALTAVRQMEAKQFGSSH
ncbi:MAG: C-3',4' desaturase CrtD [Halothece sp. Uz-M2-17]|nr:C-3',4' desaturase CrtD [Halothece sp. Uz-M2-17]